MVIIKAMLGKSFPVDSKLAIVIAQAKKEASTLGRISFFHVKRELNCEDDLWAKKATKLTKSECEKNGILSLCNIP